MPAAPEPEPEPAAQGWEDPTTVQVPTWDDEPPRTQPTQAETYAPAPVEESKLKEEPALAPVPVPAPAPATLPAQVQPQPQPAAATPTLASTLVAKADGHHARPTSAAHRHKFKTDQAVIMPGGGFSAVAVEKVGMQFGSLSLSLEVDAG